MAITLLVSANTPNPNVIGDWALMAAQVTACKMLLGRVNIPITESNTYTVPQLALGTYILHVGAVYIVDTAHFAIAAGDLAGAGVYYIRLTTSGVTLTADWESSLAGYTWNEANQGLYSGTSQVLPYAVYYDGAAGYTKRFILNFNNPDTTKHLTIRHDGVVEMQTLNTTGDVAVGNDLDVTGDADVGGDVNVTGDINPGTVTRSTQVMTSGSDYVLPRGIYILYVVYSANGNLETQFYNGSAWITSGSVAIKNSGSGFSTFIISDGSNTRIHSNNPASSTLFLHKY